MKTLLRVVILVVVVAIPTMACLYCIPCPDGGEICAGAPSASCTCSRSGGECVGYRCGCDPSGGNCGDIGLICCTHIQLSAEERAQGWVGYQVNLSNGGRIYERVRNPSVKFDPLEPFKSGGVLIRKHGSLLTAVTANRMP